MAADTHIYGEVNNKTNLRHVFRAIRRDVGRAKKREALTELYKRAGYMNTLMRGPSFGKKFRGDLREMRQIAKVEFASTARKINSRAKRIGTEPNYDESWGS
jgi:hypothetical protein